jgi:hypothetical protein
MKVHASTDVHNTSSSDVMKLKSWIVRLTNTLHNVLEWHLHASDKGFVRDALRSLA